jgi:hypothetical protein
MRLFLLGEEGGAGALHACSSAAVVAKYAGTSPLPLGGDKGYEVPGAKVGDLVHVVKLVASGAAFDAVGIYADKAAAEAAQRARKNDGARITAVEIE